MGTTTTEWLPPLPIPYTRLCKKNKCSYCLMEAMWTTGVEDHWITWTPWPQYLSGTLLSYVKLRSSLGSWRVRRGNIMIFFLLTCFTHCFTYIIVSPHLLDWYTFCWSFYFMFHFSSQLPFYRSFTYVSNVVLPIYTFEHFVYIVDVGLPCSLASL